MKAALLRLLLLAAFALQTTRFAWAQTPGVETGYRLMDDRLFTLESHHGKLFGCTEQSVYVSLDGGASWSVTNSGLPASTIYALYSNGNTLILSMAQGVFTSNNDGANWSASSLNVPYFAFASNGTVTAGGGYGIVISADNGANWSSAVDGSQVGSVLTFTVSGTRLIAGNSNGEIWVSSDNGATWTKTGTIGAFVTALTTIGSHVFAATNNAGIAHSVDGGLTWSVLNASVSVGTLMATSTGVLIAGDSYNIYRSADQGVNWTTVAPSSSPFSYREFAEHSSTLFAISVYAGLQSSTDQGQNWQDHDGQNPRLYIYAMAGSPTSVLASGPPTLFKSTDSGDNWAESIISAGDGMDEMIYDGTNYISLMSSGKIYYSADDGATWNLATGLGSAFPFDLTYSGSKLYAATNQGIKISSDHGASWINSGMNTAMDFVSSESPGTCYAYSGVTGLYKSVDSGATWSLIAGPQSSTIVTLFEVASNEVFIGTYNGLYKLSASSTWAIASPSLTNQQIQSMHASGGLLYFAYTPTFAQYVTIAMYQAGSVVPLTSNPIGSIDVRALLYHQSNLYIAYTSGTSNPSGKISKMPIVPVALVTGLSPTAGEVGSTLTIQGLNFSPTVSDNQVEIGGLQATVLSASPTALQVSVPATAGSATVKVNSGGQESVFGTPFVIKPTLTGFTPAASVTGGVVTLYGTGFDAPTLSVDLSGLSCFVLNKTPTSVSIQLPPQSNTGMLTVYSAGFQSSHSTALKVSPVITSFDPVRADPGTVITIQGTGFGSGVLPTIAFGGVPATVLIANPTYCQAIVPTGAISGALTLTTAGGTAYADRPFVLSTLPVQCPVPIPTPMITSTMITIDHAHLQSSAPIGNQWFLNGTAIPGETGSTLEVFVSGSYTVQVTIDACSSALSAAETVSVDVTGIPDTDNQELVYPNPSSGILYIRNPEFRKGEGTAQFISPTGQVIQVSLLSQPVNDVNINNLSSGIYILHLVYPTRKSIVKFVRQ